MFGKNRVLRMRINNQFGKNPADGSIYYNAERRLDKVRLYHDERKTEKCIDDITWDDLEMDQVFLRINHTNCFIGEQKLYQRLHDLDHVNDEKTQNFICENEQRRIDIEEKLCGIGKMENDYHLVKFLANPDYWKIGNGYIFTILQILLVVFLALTIILDNSICVTGLIAILVINLMIYYRAKQKYEVFLDALMSVKRIYDVAKWMDKNSEICERFSNDKVKSALKNLSKMSRLIVGFSNSRNNMMIGDAMAVLADYLWGVTLIGVSTFNRVLNIIEDKQEDVWALFDFIGDIDSEIAIASYRLSRESWCQPEIGEHSIKAEGLVHPLLNSPVANDYELENRAVITGANASGKSTFMKSLAINVILAQTINTCTAKRFCLKKVHVMTCMSLRDDILSGESYYFREAKYLKRIIDTIDNDENVLCVIDEILKGTNTNERIAASKAIMAHIARRNCFAIIATHDMELTNNDSYKKFYFDSKVEENDIVFDYIIHDGLGGKSNAIALLDLLGYPRDIVNYAREKVAGC